MRRERLIRWLQALAPWAALVIVALVAGAPLLSAGEVSGGYDTLFHYWRAVEAGELLRAGVLIPRWAPHMARGFGYPLFVFQGALSAQLAALLHLMDLSWIPALNGVYLFSLVGSALACYLLGRELWGETAGWGSAVVYLFVPYHLYVVYYRGSMSEAVAWIFPPLVLWGLTRWSEGEKTGLAVGALALAGLAMTHAVSLYLFAPLFLLWTLGEALGRGRGAWSVLGREAMLLAFGGAVGAFAWGPGLLERQFVQLARATSAWVFDYRSNFLPLSQLLALPRAADPRLINDWPARGLGLIFLLAALGGLATLGGAQALARAGARARRVRSRLLALGVALGGTLFLATGLSRPLWEAVRPLASFQFPWRWLAPATLAAALLSGAALRWVARRSRKFALVAIVLLATAHLGWLYPGGGGLPGPASPAGLVDWELATDTVGTTASNELLPRWAEMVPRDNPVTEAILNGTKPQRLDRDTLPEGSVVISELYKTLGAKIALSSPQDFVARYRAFYYPGWRVTVDGESRAVAPEPLSGWLAFVVPAGEHVVEVVFGESPLRQWLNVVSLFSFVVLIGLVATPVFGTSTVSLARAKRDTASGLAPSFLVAALLLLVLKVVADRLPVGWRGSRLRADSTLRGVVRPLDVNFDGRARLLGVDPLPASLQADVVSRLTLYWQALEPGERDWHVGLTLVGPDGSRRQAALRPYRWSRTPPPLSQWPRESYGRMDYEVHLPPGMPPGAYTVELSLFDRASAAPASALDALGNPLGPALALDRITVERPVSPPSLDVLGVREDAEMVRCGALGLWRMSVDRERAAPGDPLQIEMIWEAVAAPVANLSATLSLRDGATELRSWALPPAAPWWPTSRWRAGDRWLGRADLRVPSSVTSGTYMLVLALPGCPDLALRDLRIEAPDRAWKVPDDFAPLDVPFGAPPVSGPTFEGVVRLAGVRLAPTVVEPGEVLDLALAWEALTEMERAYRVYTHLLDPAGNLVTQNDGEPAGWTRPTPGWAVDEVVVDPRPLEVPDATLPGTYTIRVGMYEPGGSRLQTGEGADGVVVGTVEVSPGE
ncbi:MAG: hypothetical protein ACP5JG_02390 [Anaerolineae bacterium]